MKTKSVYVALDPTEKYSEVNREDLIQSMGILPQWGGVALNSEEPLHKTMASLYGFGPLFHMTGGVVWEDGTYHYPEDPPLPPIGRMGGKSRRIYFYPHAIVAMYEDGRYFVTRMD